MLIFIIIVIAAYAAFKWAEKHGFKQNPNLDQPSSHYFGDDEVERDLKKK